VTTSGSPVSPNIAAFSSSTAITAATSANIQTAIGASVYDAYGAAAARQANLSLLAGTYADGDLCTYTASGTLLNCNTAANTLAVASAGTATTAANLSGTPALPNGTTATTQGAGDNSGKLATTASLNLPTQTPAWLQYLGTGADGSCDVGSGKTGCNGVNGWGGTTTNSATAFGEYYFTNFTLEAGATLSLNGAGGLIIHATGACTISGNITSNPTGAFAYPAGGGSGASGGW